MSSWGSKIGRLVGTVVATVPLVLGAAIAAPSAQAAPYSNAWTGSGPGTTAVVSDGTSTPPQFTYNINPSGSGQTWQFTTVSDVDGRIAVPYDYSGFHSYFLVTAFLRVVVVHDGVRATTPLVNAGPANCCSSPSNGFRYQGTATIDVAAGDTYGFEFGGSNADSDNVLAGSLTLGEQTLLSRSQAITFTQPSDMVVGQPDATLDATSDSGLAVTLASTTTDVCTVDGATVHAVSPGTCTLTADQAGDATYSAAPTVTRSFAVTAAVATTLDLAVDPTRVDADGSSTATATATVLDGFDNPLPGQTVTFTADDPDVTVGDVTDEGDGTYSATVTASTTAHEVTLTATSGEATDTATLTLTAVATSVDVDVAPTSVPADGSSTATVIVTVLDAGEAPLSGATVTLTADDPGVAVGDVTDEGDGTYSATVTASTTVHDVTLTAAAGGVEGSATLTLTALPTTPPATTPPATTPPVTAGPTAGDVPTASPTTVAAAGELAATGSDPAPALLTALALLATGIVLVALVRRPARRH